jgi:hypothetical protein
MNVRHIGLIVSAIAVLAPAISNASTQKQALDACARAFASSLASAGSPSPVFKVVFRNGAEPSNSVTQYFAREYTFYLRADDKTGALIARASCSTDARGTVVDLTPATPADLHTTLAARE